MCPNPDVWLFVLFWLYMKFKLHNFLPLELQCMIDQLAVQGKTLNFSNEQRCFDGVAPYLGLSLVFSLNWYCQALIVCCTLSLHFSLPVQEKTIHLKSTECVKAWWGKINKYTSMIAFVSILNELLRCQGHLRSQKECLTWRLDPPPLSLPQPVLYREIINC